MVTGSKKNVCSSFKGAGVWQKKLRTISGSCCSERHFRANLCWTSLPVIAFQSSSCVCERERKILTACEEGLRAEEAFVYETVWDNALWLLRYFPFRSWALFSLLKFRVPLNTLLTICYITHRPTHTHSYSWASSTFCHHIISGYNDLLYYSFAADTVLINRRVLRHVESHIWNFIYSFSKVRPLKTEVDLTKRSMCCC